MGSPMEVDSSIPAMKSIVSGQSSSPISFKTLQQHDRFPYMSIQHTHTGQSALQSHPSCRPVKERWLRRVAHVKVEKKEEKIQPKA